MLLLTKQPCWKRTENCSRYARWLICHVESLWCYSVCHKGHIGRLRDVPHALAPLLLKCSSSHFLRSLRSRNCCFPWHLVHRTSSRHLCLSAAHVYLVLHYCCMLLQLKAQMAELKQKLLEAQARPDMTDVFVQVGRWGGYCKRKLIICLRATDINRRTSRHLSCSRAAALSAVSVLWLREAACEQHVFKQLTASCRFSLGDLLRPGQRRGD